MADLQKVRGSIEKALSTRLWIALAVMTGLSAVAVLLGLFGVEWFVTDATGQGLGAIVAFVLVTVGALVTAVGMLQTCMGVKTSLETAYKGCSLVQYGYIIVMVAELLAGVVTVIELLDWIDADKSAILPLVMAIADIAVALLLPFLMITVMQTLKGYIAVADGKKPLSAVRPIEKLTVIAIGVLAVFSVLTSMSENGGLLTFDVLMTAIVSAVRVALVCKVYDAILRISQPSTPATAKNAAETPKTAQRPLGDQWKEAAAKDEPTEDNFYDF